MFLAGLAAGLAVSGSPRAHGCAFPSPPTTYEAAQDRFPYLIGEGLAANNQLFPADTFFGTPHIETGTRDDRRMADTPYIPPTILKASGWIESALTQGASSVPWNATGPALVSFDCGYGIMQITSGMTQGEDSGRPSQHQALVATHYLYNIGRGAAILADKWNAAPEARPIAGTDTDSDPTIAENWYFAVWSYNGFTGPARTAATIRCRRATPASVAAIAVVQPTTATAIAMAITRTRRSSSAARRGRRP